MRELTELPTLVSECKRLDTLIYALAEKIGECDCIECLDLINQAEKLHSVSFDYDSSLSYYPLDERELTADDTEAVKALHARLTLRKHQCSSVLDNLDSLQGMGVTVISALSEEATLFVEQLTLPIPRPFGEAAGVLVGEQDPLLILLPKQGLFYRLLVALKPGRLGAWPFLVCDVTEELKRALLNREKNLTRVIDNSFRYWLLSDYGADNEIQLWRIGKVPITWLTTSPLYKSSVKNIYD